MVIVTFATIVNYEELYNIIKNTSQTNNNHDNGEEKQFPYENHEVRMATLEKHPSDMAFLYD